MSKQGQWIKCIASERNLKGVVIDARSLVQEIIDMHDLKGKGAKGLGEALLSGLLVSSTCKIGEKINLNIQGNQTFKQAIVDAYPEGKVRGYIILSDYIDQKDEKLGDWGEGLISVLRTKDQEGKQPYIGTVPLITGHLAKDLAFYWHQSEQIPSAVGISVEVEKSHVKTATAFLIQAMPGALDSDLKIIEERVTQIDQKLMRISPKQELKSVLTHLFQDGAFMIIEEKPVTFDCNCTWERVNRALSLVGAEELNAMIKEDGGAVIHCDFCRKEYKLSVEQLKTLIKN